MTQCVVYASPNLATNLRIDIPGDKSISHRALMIGALATGTYCFHNFLASDDCLHTMAIFRQLGVQIEFNSNQKTITIHGVGLHGLKPSNQILDVGNSGTLIRLITGVLAAQSFSSEITGDESIQKRPMRRIIDPLIQMNADITGQSGKKPGDIVPPLHIKGNPSLCPITYSLPMASAQVKSAVLLAGLYAIGTTVIIEPAPCRDHTERMLRLFGAAIQSTAGQISLTGPAHLATHESNLFIPSDISSAAFWMVLGLIRKNMRLVLPHIGLNPTRNKLIEILQQMGGRITIDNANYSAFEPYGDIVIQSSDLHNITVQAEDIPNIIDEIPILSVAALFAKGQLRIRNAKELRVKESDRISAIVHMIRAMGGNITEYEDGFDIEGGTGVTKDFEIESYFDHRIAMSAIIAAAAANKQGLIHPVECINTSFPVFFDILKQLQLNFNVE